MKLLLFSDLHCDAGAARRLVEMASAADVVIGAGDFANMRHGIEECISILCRITKPTVLVAGNNESTEELIAACADWPSATVLHGSGVSINGVKFFGIGGGIPVTPFGSWSYDFSEEQAAKLLIDCPLDCVLATHSPPKGAVDLSSRRQSIGSMAIRDAIERVHPRLVVCGHVHASAGQRAMLGTSAVINAGPTGTVWTLEASSTDL